MEFIYANYLNTTGSITINSNTAGAANLYSTDIRQQWYSSGLNDDSLPASITISFSSTQTVSRLVLMNINAKKMTIYYNGATANTFALTTTAATTTASFTNNSETSLYLTTTPVDCTSVTIDIYSTQVANSEKAIGWLAVSDLLLDFERIPSANNYKVMLDPQRVEHKLSDGGTRIQFTRDVMRADISFEYLSASFTSSLRSVYDLQTDYIFCAFPTTTGWDKVCFPCVWTGPYDFLNYSDNAANSGFGGKIQLRQIPQ